MERFNQDQPPANEIVWPVRYTALPEASSAINSAISSARPKCLSGTFSDHLPQLRVLLPLLPPLAGKLAGVLSSPMHRAERGYLIASALGGEPTPPGIFSGAEVMKKL